ncbi:MAG: menaquinone biosynthesis protein [Bacteroidetes bacterium]|nr:menaquinone biosynthesis protein [Bacteroidota bacterium]
MNLVSSAIFAPKFNLLSAKIKVAAVSYLNTKPLLYGIERSAVMNDIDLLLDYPSNLAKDLSEGKIDVALLPVAAIPTITGANIISDYGIAADGNVASVSVFSMVPMSEIKTVYLDYQSRTSVRLAQLLFEKLWKQDVAFKPAPENYIDYINGTTAGVIIGDRALKQRTNFEYVYDLADGWKELTGLPFVFAAWVANKELPETFKAAFNTANAEGLQHIDEVVAENPFPYYDLKTYYTENIHYMLDEQKKNGLELFLQMIK